MRITHIDELIKYLQNVSDNLEVMISDHEKKGISPIDEEGSVYWMKNYRLTVMNHQMGLLNIKSGEIKID